MHQGPLSKTSLGCNHSKAIQFLADLTIYVLLFDDEKMISKSKLSSTIFYYLDQKAECAVCQDQFIMEEKVKQLPCKHNFHTPCIDPWLKMVINTYYIF